MHCDLLLRKGVFPYSYLDSFEKLKDTSLPPKHCFYNILTNSHISDEDYEHAQLVYATFCCKNFGNYLELYQQTDTLLLAEVFTSFRKMSVDCYGLDPVHFLTAAQLTWNAGLKYTRVELELLTNVNDYIWLESGMRGGISFLGTRYASANSPYIPETYDSNKPQNHILALDANNLYGYVMSQKLPIGNFSWLTPDEVTNFNLLEYDENSDVGFILEVDLFCPPSLHHKFNDLPLAAEHLSITYEMLSEYSKKICDKLNLKHTLPSKKLTPNFHPKKNYITHYLNLKFYVEAGMIVTKIHKIFAFHQSNWLEPYITFNNTKRLEATNNFDKTFYKLLNNAFYGRLMLNQRKKVNVVGSLNLEDCKKNLASPLLEYFEPINETLTLFKMKQKNLMLDKPIYAGFSILELSKLHMYQLYYSHLKAFYNENIELLYMDTDSLYLNVTSNNIYQELTTQFADILDLSNFPSDHALYNTSNRGKLGLLKSETIYPISEFIGLKPKMYCFGYGDTCKMRAKGIKKSSLKNFTLETYKSILAGESCNKQLQHNIISKKHNLLTVAQNKVGLSCYYDKKFVEEDGIHCLAYGHHLIENPNNDVDDDLAYGRYLRRNMINDEEFHEYRM